MAVLCLTILGQVSQIPVGLGWSPLISMRVFESIKFESKVCHFFYRLRKDEKSVPMIINLQRKQYHSKEHFS